MPVSPHGTSFLDMPPEIICRIAYWGQLRWIQDVFDDVGRPIPTPISEDGWSRRKAVELGTAEMPCLGSTGFVSQCLKNGDLRVHDLSFLQTLSRVSRWVYYVLNQDKQLWRFENTLHKALVERAGKPAPAPAYSVAAGGRVHYEHGILIAERVCSHIHGVFSWYPSLSKIKISTSWHHPLDPTQSVSDMFMNRLPKSDGPLKHFDLCLDGLKGPMRPQRRLQPMRSAHIRFCRVINTDFFLFGPHLRDLYIGSKSPAYGWEPIVLHRNFLNALAVCAETLEYLTLDLSGAHSFIRFRPDPGVQDVFDTHLPSLVNLPALRYLRLSVPEEAACELLQRLSLPPQIDLHLEPAVRTRDIVFPELHGERWPFMLAQSSELPEDIWWKFAASLEIPEQTYSIFGWPGLVQPPPTQPFTAVHVLALDIQIPGPYKPLQPEFPTSVSVSLADSPQSATSVVVDGPSQLRVRPPGLPSRVTSPTLHRAPVRSLVIRHKGSNGLPPATVSGRSIMNPLHATVDYLMALVTKGRLHKPYTGFSGSIDCVLVMPGSWCPEKEVDWNAALRHTPLLSRLEIHSLRARPSSPHNEWRRGVVSLSHLQGLVAYLMEPQAGEQRLPLLESIAVPHYVPTFCSREEIEVWLMCRLNTPARLAGGARRITCTLTDAGMTCQCKRLDYS